MTEDIDQLIKKGGVYYNVSGNTPFEVFLDAVSQIFLPPSIDSKKLYTSLCERERLMTTSIGNGIALPHPREPFVFTEADQQVSVCFLEKPVNFNSIDGKLVSVIFIVLSVGGQNHLRILSQLSWILQKDSFRALLKQKPDTEELVSFIGHLSSTK